MKCKDVLLVLEMFRSDEIYSRLQQQVGEDEDKCDVSRCSSSSDKPTLGL